MADAITIKALQDASLDAKSLEEVVNGDEAKQVTTRKGENYPSVKKAIKTLFENGGLPATPFASKALMTASALVDGDYAMVTDDTVNNGLYVKTAGAWVKSDYDPLTQAKAYADTNKADTLLRVQNVFATKALMAESDLVDGSNAQVNNDTTTDNNGFYKKTEGTWVRSAYDPIGIMQGSIDVKLTEKADVFYDDNNELLYGFADSEGKVYAAIDNKASFLGTDFKTENDSLSSIREDLQDRLTYTSNDDHLFGIADSKGKLVGYLSDDGQLHLSHLNDSLQVEVARLKRASQNAIGLPLKLRHRSETEVDAFEKLYDAYASQEYAVKSRVRLAEYRSGSNHHIQRIPVVYRVDDNRALVFFNRGLLGYDGDYAGAEMFKSEVTWSDDYKIIDFKEPELFYSVQDQAAGGAVKHCTIGRLKNGDLYMLTDLRFEEAATTQYIQHYSTSNDNGDTWSEWIPVVYNNSFIIGEDMTYVLGTGGKILTLDDGRLVTTVYTSTEQTRRFAYIYSDDNGSTWTVSNPLGGVESEASGVYLSEATIDLLPNGDIVSYVRTSGVLAKQKVISYDRGETAVYIGVEESFVSARGQASSDMLLDDILLLATPQGRDRDNFAVLVGLNNGERFDFIKYNPFALDNYKGYSSLEVIDNNAILLAVEGADGAGQVNRSESIDLVMFNLKEMIENGTIS